MRFRTLAQQDNDRFDKLKKEKGDWHIWFAWKPVVAKNKSWVFGKERWVWLEKVERKWNYGWEYQELRGKQKHL